MTEILIPNPLDTRTDELDNRSTAANALLVAAEDFVIEGPPTYEIAIDETQKLRGFIKNVKEWFEPMASAANAVHKSITSRRGEIVTPAEEAIKIYEGKITAYRLEEERKARALAEQERKRLEAEARAAREAEALAAADKGDEAKFDALASMDAAPVPAAPVAAQVMETRAPKVKGMAVRKQWKARWASNHPAQVFDECAPALCEAIAKGEVAASMIVPNWDALAKLAEATAGRARVPGIEFYEEVKTTIRGR